MIESGPPSGLGAGSRAAAVEAVALTAAYGDRVVWADARFTIPTPSFTAVLGPNGSGKSTLLQMILGRLRPAAGHLRVFGSEPSRGNPAIGYVPQASQFDPELGVRGVDYVGLGLDGHKWGIGPLSSRERRHRIDAAIAAVEAAEYARRPIGRLSGGERQRLVLAQAIVGEPRLLLLDEPLSNLDVRSQTGIVRLVADLVATRSLAAILVAHDVNPLLPHIDLVVYAARGRLAAGPPREIIDGPALSRIYDAPIEVLRDSRGRLFVAGLEEEVGHPHAG